jgi:hypothetical protein
MVDNVTVGGVSYSTDDITTLNGGAVAAGSAQTQRIKIQFGDDGTARDVSGAFPLPITDADTTAAGTITATDAALGTHGGLGVPLTGTPTANSYVAFPMTGGESGFTLRLSGTFGGGTVWMESSVDSTNGVDGGWTTNLVRQSGVDITFLDASITAAGIFRGVAAGYSYLRVRVTGATAPSIGVAFRASVGPSVTALVAPIPAGWNTFGAIHPASQFTTGTAASNGFVARSATVGTSSAVLQAAPAAGLSLYVTDISVSNSGATLSVVSLLPTAGTAFIDIVAAASGGGGSMNFRTPVKLAAQTGLSVIASAASTSLYCTATGYTAP